MRRSLAAFLVGVALVAAVVAGIWLLGAKAVPEPRPLGDQLGPDLGESFAEYSARSADSLAAAPSDEPAFALVTFAQPQRPADAAAALRSVSRVNAVVAPEASPEPVGESADGPAGREHVFRNALSEFPEGTRIVSVVVWDTGDVLRTLSEGHEGNEKNAVAVVEVLPPDAVWGSFGVTPLEVSM